MSLFTAIAASIGIAGDACTHDLSSYADFSAAVAAIGGTEAVLCIDTNSDVSTNEVIPATLRLKPESGILTVTGNGAIEFAGQGVTSPISQVPMFRCSVVRGIVFGPLNYHIVNNTIEFASYFPDLTTGEKLRYTVENGTAAGGLTSGNSYYWISTATRTGKLALTYADAIGNVPIDITSAGVGSQISQSLMPMKVAWTGATFPATISTELFETDNVSESERVLLCSQAFYGKTCTIRVTPRTIDSHVELADRQSIYWREGTSENTWKPTGSDLDWPPYTIGSNATASSDYSALGTAYVFKESDQDNYTQLIHTRLGAENATIENIYFQGQGTVFNGAHAGVGINGGSNNHCINCYFNECNSYHATILHNATDSTIDGCYSKNYLTQCQNIIAGIRCAIKNGTIDLNGTSGLAAFTPLDIEPNAPSDVLEDIEISNMTIDARNLANPSTTVRGMMVQATNSQGCDGLTVFGNIILTNDLVDPPTTSSVLGISIEGASNIDVYDNEVQGVAFNSSLFLRQCRGGQVRQNNLNGNISRIELNATADMDVFENVQTTVANGYSQVWDIIESGQQDHPLLASTVSEIQFRYTVHNIQAGRAYSHYTGLNILINTNTYEVTDVLFAEPRMSLEIDAVVNDGFDALEFTSADVNDTTNRITVAGHGVVTGCKLQYSPDTGSTAIGNLTTDAMYWAIRIDDDTLQIATTLADALANTPRDFTNAGVGDHFLFFVAETQFGNNTYWDNTTSGYTLDPGMGSVVL